MLEAMRDTAHDAQHVYRVLDGALLIAEEMPGVNRDVLIAACLLHDIGREAQYRDERLCHAREGAKMAYDYLVEIGWTGQDAGRVRDCIRTHRYRGDDQPASDEAKVLFDADKLDAAGALAVARTVMYCALVGEPIYSVGEDGRPLDGSGDEPPSFMNEYCVKLSRIYDQFYPAKGRELGLERKPILTAFYQALRREAAQLSGDGEAARLEKVSRG